MGNPYPQWMSGIAMERPTIPGIGATFATCSGAKSLRTWSIIFASAKIRPSVRISGLYDLGMRYEYESSCCVGPFHSSGIENRQTIRGRDIAFSGGGQYSPRLPSVLAFR